MKHLKTILLTTLLSVGFFLPSCEDGMLGGVDCDCSSSRFFDIEGLDLYTFLDEPGTIGDWIAPGDTVPFSDFGGLYLDYRTTYHAQAAPKTNWSFSLMNTAFACSCIGGFDGSKTEALVSLTITTLNDFDSAHPAGTDIVDLLEFKGSLFLQEDDEPLADFLAGLSGNLEREDMFLNLTKAPELDPEFRFSVRMELSTGEVYEAESAPVVIMP